MPPTFRPIIAVRCLLRAIFFSQSLYLFVDMLRSALTFPAYRQYLVAYGRLFCAPYATFLIRNHVDIKAKRQKSYNKIRWCND